MQNKKLLMDLLIQLQVFEMASKIRIKTYNLSNCEISRAKVFKDSFQFV